MMDDWEAHSYIRNNRILPFGPVCQSILRIVTKPPPTTKTYLKSCVRRSCFPLDYTTTNDVKLFTCKTNASITSLGFIAFGFFINRRTVACDTITSWKHKYPLMATPIHPLYATQGSFTPGGCVYCRCEGCVIDHSAVQTPFTFPQALTPQY